VNTAKLTNATLTTAAEGGALRILRLYDSADNPDPICKPKVPRRCSTNDIDDDYADVMKCGRKRLTGDAGWVWAKPCTQDEPWMKTSEECECD
jgi:hypothetical protein